MVLHNEQGLFRLHCLQFLLPLPLFLQLLLISNATRLFIFSKLRKHIPKSYAQNYCYYSNFSILTTFLDKKACQNISLSVQVVARMPFILDNVLLLLQDLCLQMDVLINFSETEQLFRQKEWLVLRFFLWKLWKMSA